jgi:hypothetical protein
MAGHVVTEGDDLTLRLASDAVVPLPAAMRLTAELLTRRGEARTVPPGVVVDVVFEHLALVDVTAFVVLRLRDGRGEERSTVVRVLLIGDPPGRLDAVLARQVDTPEKFLRFLTLVLGLDQDAGALGAGSRGGEGRWVAGGGPGIFELLVRSLVDKPQALADVARLVERLRATVEGASLLPDGFDELWEAVETARQDSLRAER